MKRSLIQIYALCFFLFFGFLHKGIAQDGMEEMMKEIIKEKLISNKLGLKSSSEKITTRGSEEHKFSRVTSSSTQEGEPMIIINPDNEYHIVASYMTFDPSGLDMSTFVTFNGGNIWVPSKLDVNFLYNKDATRRSHSVIGGGDPMMAFGPDGTLYYTWVNLGLKTFDDTRWYNFFVESKDGGVTFSEVEGGNLVINEGGLNLNTGVPTGHGDGIYDRHWIAVDRTNGSGRGNVYLAGLFVPGTTTSKRGPGIAVRRKLAGSPIFEKDDILLVNSNNVQFSQILVDEKGAIHVIYGDLDRQKIMHQMSIDEGVTFSNPRVVGGLTYDPSAANRIHDRENPVPSLVIDRKNNVLHVAWTTLGVIPRPLYSKSVDGGVTWSSPIDINQYAPDNYTGGHLVSLACDKEGRLSAFYYGMRGKENDYVHLLSNDEGISFGEFQVVTASPTDFSSYPINNPFSETFFGDYFSSVSGNCSSYGIYSDGRLGQGPKVYVSKVDVCNGVSSQRNFLFNDSRFVVRSLVDSDAIIWSLDASQSGKGEMILVNSNGQIVYQKEVSIMEGNNEGKIQKRLQSGIYVVQLKVGKQVFIRKIRCM